MSNTEGAVSPREQRLRDLYAEISRDGVSLATKAKARELLDELNETQEKKQTLSGYEASKLPWLHNIAK